MSKLVRFPLGGDNLTLDVYIKDQNDLTVDLTNGSVVLYVEAANITSISHPGSIVDAPAGLCRFTIGRNNVLANQGRFRARVTTTLGPQIIPSEWFEIVVI